MAGLVWLGWSSVFAPCLLRCRPPRPRANGLRALREINHPRPDAAARGEGEAFLAAFAFPRAVAPLALANSVARARIGSLSILSAASTRAMPETKALVARAGP